MNIRSFYESFSREAIAGGKIIYESGGVTRLTRGLSGRYYGSVRDKSVEYRTVVTVSDDMNASELGCSCPSASFCSHEAAFLFAILAGTDKPAGKELNRNCRFSGHGYLSVCPEYVSAAARGRETVACARRIAETDRVRILADYINSDGNRAVSARVGSHNRFSSSEEETELVFGPDGLPKAGRCGCMPDGGDFLCEHMTALLFSLFPEDTAPEVETPDSVKRLIKSAAMRKRFPTAPGSVRLEPELSLSFDSRLRLDFCIGREKLFAVRSIPELLENIKAGVTAGYGRNCVIDHSIDSFDEQSKAYIRFLRSRRGDEVPGYGHSPAGVYLSEDNIDDFFSIAEAEKIRFDGREVSLRREDPELKLSIVRAGRNGCRVAFDGEALCLLGCGERCYVLKSDCIYISGRDFAGSAAGLLKILGEEGRDGLSLSLSDLKAFFSGVLLPLKQYAVWSLGDEKLREYIPPELECRVKISSDSPSSARAELEFRYGDSVFKGFGEKTGAGFRDIVGEERAESIVREFFPNMDLAGQAACIFDSEDGVYRLVKEGLPKLREAAKVSVSGDFALAKVRRGADVRISLDLSGEGVDLNLDAGGYSMEELAAILNAMETGESFVRFDDGTYADLESGDFDELGQLVFGLALDPAELSEHMKLPKYRMLFLEAMARENSRLTFERSRVFRREAGSFDALLSENDEVPESFAGKLRPYQAEGFFWMKAIESRGFGGILADDMGLGKTVQALALLLSAPPAGAEGLPGIVVCPTSIVSNWMSECERFAPSIRAVAVTGTAAERAARIASLSDCGLVVTSYDSLKRDAPLYAGTEFRVVIADEAQFIKNRYTQAANAVKALRARSRIALTGTPVENYPSELWSIFDFLMPGYLGSYARFRSRTELPIARGSREALMLLRRQTAPFMLRRVKRDVLRELPEKTESVLYTRFGSAQKKAYTAVSAALVAELRAKLAAAGFRAEDNIAVLTLLLRLRQICCHPPLCLGDAYAGGSAKLELCMELLSSLLSGGHSVLLFSQFTSMLDVLAEKLEEEKTEYFVLTGKTPPEERLDIVRRFNDGERKVFLVSLKAGGTGLNLTGADTVIHYDPWWNTAAQNQATDRAYRIGQDRHVHVYRLIVEDSIEQKIMEFQEKKAELAAALVDGSDGSAARLSPEELLELFEN